MADLRGRIAVVTGAGGGVGRGVAQGLAEAGATVYVTDARPDAAREDTAGGSIERARTAIEVTASEVDALGGVGIAVPGDHGDDAVLRSLFDRVGRDAERLDLLVNCAFRSPAPSLLEGGFWMQPISVWDDMARVGCRSHYLASVHAAAIMVPQGSGLIVHLSSIGGGEYRFGVAYGTGRGAVDRMARDMAQELRPFGVAALSLWPEAPAARDWRSAVEISGAWQDPGAAAHPRLTGRGVAALARDPDVLEKSGGVYAVADLAREYRFTDAETTAD